MGISHHRPRRARARARRVRGRACVCEFGYIVSEMSGGPSPAAGRPRRSHWSGSGARAAACWTWTSWVCGRGIVCELERHINPSLLYSLLNGVAKPCSQWVQLEYVLEGKDAVRAAGGVRAPGKTPPCHLCARVLLHLLLLRWFVPRQVRAS